MSLANQLLLFPVRTQVFHKAQDQKEKPSEHEAMLDWKDDDLKAKHVFISPELDKIGMGDTWIFLRMHCHD